MMTIWKYEVPVRDSFELELPKGAEILSCQNQHGGSESLQMWALMDTEAEKEIRRFRIYGTGHPIEQKQKPMVRIIEGGITRNLAPLRHIATVVVSGGMLVWHLFEEIK